jgi:uncharacterized membrane protein YfcA
LCWTIFWQLRAHCRLERIRWMIAGTVVGMPLGILFLMSSPGAWLNLFFGVLLVFTCVYSLVPHLSRHRWHPLYLGLPCGVASGFLSGAFSSGGPPAVAFMTTQQFDRLRYVASMQAMFVVSSSLRVISLTVIGAYQRELLAYSAAGMVAMAGGSVLGVWLLRRFSDRRMRQVLLTALLALGGWYLVRGFFDLLA